MPDQSCWKTLEISPTKDIATIQSAYASAARKYHPEEHPEQWSRIHDAYLDAIAYAQGTFARAGFSVAGPRRTAPHDKLENDASTEYAELFENSLHRPSAKPLDDGSVKAELERYLTRSAPVKYKEACVIVDLLHGLAVDPDYPQSEQPFWSFLIISHSNHFTDRSLPVFHEAVYQFIEIFGFSNALQKEMEAEASRLGSLIRDETQKTLASRLAIPICWMSASLILISAVSDYLIGAVAPIVALVSYYLLLEKDPTYKRIGTVKLYTPLDRNKSLLPKETNRITWLAVSAFCLVLVCSIIGMNISARYGIKPLYLEKEIIYTPFSPSMEKNTCASLTLGRTPEYLGQGYCTTTKRYYLNGRWQSVQSTITIHYYSAVTESNSECIVAVSQSDQSMFASRALTGHTLYGNAYRWDTAPVLYNTGTTFSDVLFIPNDHYVILDSEDPNYMLFRYDPDAIHSKTIATGKYEPGRVPFVIFVFLLVGSTMSLFVFVIRKIKRMFFLKNLKSAADGYYSVKIQAE